MYERKKKDLISITKYSHSMSLSLLLNILKKRDTLALHL